MRLRFDLNQIKSQFFFTKAGKANPIRAVLGAATFSAFSKLGQLIRTTSRASIRKRKRAAPPGQPPSSHTGLLKRFIFYSFDQRAWSVVVGPLRAQSSGRSRSQPASGTVPETLEEGGRIRLTMRRGKSQTTNTAKVDSRPFMKPAYDKHITQLPRLLRAESR